MNKYTTTILICDDVPDSSGETILLEGVTFKNTLPVFLFNGGIAIGSAHFKKEGNAVIAEMYTDDPLNFPMTELYGVVGGRIISRENDVITKCTITEVILTGSPADKRLPKLRKV